MNSLAVKTQAPRTATTVVTIIYNFFYVHRYMRVQCQFAVVVIRRWRWWWCAMVSSAGLFGPRISPTTAEDCGTQFATLLLQFAARMLEILFLYLSFVFLADRRRGWVRERDRDRERESARAAVLFIITI